MTRKTGGKSFKRHSPCVSEFDYEAWKVYGDWRRQYSDEEEKWGQEKSYARSCDYPSECRWSVIQSIQQEVRRASIAEVIDMIATRTVDIGDMTRSATEMETEPDHVDENDEPESATLLPTADTETESSKSKDDPTRRWSMWIENGILAVTTLTITSK
jgi:hypothetical protein